MLQVIFVALLGVAGLFQASDALENGLARTPPMGWLAWERFTCETDCTKRPNDCISGQLFKSMANRLVDDGYLGAGYEYVNIDDCWSSKDRDSSTKRLLPDPKRFPEGIAQLAEYMHLKGLKLGIYGDCGTSTCAGYPAQLVPGETHHAQRNYFALDAWTFSQWQVDSFKFDGCNLDPKLAESICPQMGQNLQTEGRFTLVTCEWPFYMLQLSPPLEPDYTVAQSGCNMWRYYGDVEDSWLSVLSIVDFTIKIQSTIVNIHGPGSWFDPDQLVIGNFGLSLDQARAQMALWCVWSAPLFMSNDLRDLEPEMGEILKNEKLIDVDQDKLGVFGLMVNETDQGRLQAFVKPVEPIKNGCPSFVIVYLNRHTLGNAKEVSLDLRQLLSSSALEVAAKRYNQLYKDTHKPGGDFSFDDCKNRLRLATTRDPNLVPPKLIVRPANQPDIKFIEESSVQYNVEDLFADQRRFTIALNSTLRLNVNPSGVRVVRLTETNSEAQGSSSVRPYQ